MKRLGLLIFILVVVYFIFLIRQDIIDNLELKKENNRVLRLLNEEMRVSEVLKREVVEAGNESKIEMRARSKLGLVKQGEKAYKVIF